MGDDEAEEFVIILLGYSLILSETPIKTFQFNRNPGITNSTPFYFDRHNVFTTSWNFVNQRTNNVITSFEIEPKLLLETITKHKAISENKTTREANINTTDNSIDRFVKQFIVHAAPSNEAEISLEELMKYIIPPPPPPKNSSYNNLELPPKNYCNLPPKLPPKSSHIKTKLVNQLVNRYSKFFDDLIAKINFEYNNSINIEYKNKNYHLINHELIVQISKLVTTSKLLLVSISEMDNVKNQSEIENTLELCKLSVEKVFDLCMELKYSPEMIEYSNMLLNKLENVLIHFRILINSDLTAKHELSSNAEKIADNLAIFLRTLSNSEFE